MLRASLEKLYIQSEELGPIMQRKFHLKNYNKSLYVSGLWISPTGTMYVFCFLSSFTPPPSSYQCLDPTCHLSTLKLTNTASPVRACLSTLWERFRESKKKTSVGLFVQWAQQNVTGSFAHDCGFSVNTSALQFFFLWLAMCLMMKLRKIQHARCS
jgi:hypothetical protein